MTTGVTPPVADGTTALAQAHRLPVDQVLALTGTDPATGLTAPEAASRLAQSGPNRLAEPARRPEWLRFADQFRSTLILVLIGAAVLAGIVGDLKDTIVITVVLLINATIGYVQERRAERSLEALRSMLVPTARVRRDGRQEVIPAADLVPGDIVLLEAGDRIPADGRLLLAESLEVDESTFTGESVPVAKHSRAVTGGGRDGGSDSGDDDGSEVPLAERTGSGFMNTTVTRGRAEMLVTATGMATQVGLIAEQLRQGDAGITPLQRRLDGLGKRLALIGVVAVTVYASLAWLRGEAFTDLALRAVALAVATVPEGLPAVLALTLALGVYRMARRGAIVKRLSSVETLGSATVVCSDKTGTLTLNQMTVREVLAAGARYQVSGSGYDPVGEVTPASATTGDGGALQATVNTLALCNDASLTPADGDGPAGIVGDPTEAALVVLAAKAGLDVEPLRAGNPRLAELPFDATHKYMATFHGQDGVVQVHVKGAVDILLERCSTVLTPDGPVPLDPAGRARVTDHVSSLGRQGLRVLGAATRTLDALPAVSGEPDGGEATLRDQVRDLTLLGVVGIADPPRPQARDAVALCRRAGVQVTMITGDHRDTAAAIAAELGITGRVLTGAELDRMTPEDLAAQIEGIGVLARVSPHHKVAVVDALRARGHVVAMTGDGVNDAAALRRADIGVAMGITGTEVTKEAGDMVLADDDFGTITKAIHEGRAIYDNVLKFVRFQLSTNVGAILTFLGSALAGFPSPLSAIQILWVNIIMDGPPAMALGVDPARRGLMDEPPRRPDDAVLSGRLLARLLRAGATMALGTLVVLVTARESFGGAVATTMAFTTFVLFQFFNVLNARAGTQTVFTRHLFTNPTLWISLGAVVVLQVIVVQVPFLHAIFDTTALTAAQWAICLGVAASILAIEELIKLVSSVARRPRGITA
ncbi:MAG: HAD-IC family P-type ATPase [Kineosporiaceae bacterium]|nr:HAD-IC family P-type ATPase [Kineosporiaceae bacterium]